MTYISKLLTPAKDFCLLSGFPDLYTCSGSLIHKVLKAEDQNNSQATSIFLRLAICALSTNYILLAFCQYRKRSFGLFFFCLLKTQQMLSGNADSADYPSGERRSNVPDIRFRTAPAFQCSRHTHRWLLMWKRGGICHQLLADDITLWLRLFFCNQE